MREIKFRAWDGKKMLYADGLEIYKNVKMGYLTDFSQSSEEYLETSITQFTGLYDKNGKEIYEGDVVKWETFYYDFDKPIFKNDKVPITKMGQIVWRDKGFCVDKEDFGWEGEGLWKWEQIEVIGNIYENPDLV